MYKYRKPKLLREVRRLGTDVSRTKLLLIGGSYYTLVAPDAPPKLRPGSKFRSECRHWDHCQGNDGKGVIFDRVRRVVRVRKASEDELGVIQRSSAPHAASMLGPGELVVVELKDVLRDDATALTRLTKHQLFYEWWLQP